MKTISADKFTALCSALGKYRALKRRAFSKDDVQCAEALVRVVCCGVPGAQAHARSGPLFGLSVVVVGLGLATRVFFEESGVSPWVKAAGMILEKFGFRSFDALEIWLDLHETKPKLKAQANA